MGQLTLLILSLLVWKTKANFYQSRIYGGFDISIERAPHYAQLLIHNYYHCGGSILAKQVVLTACHCVKVIWPFFVIVGSDKKAQGTPIKVEDVIVHPDYGEILGASYNDVALLILEKPLQYSSCVQPISIPNIWMPPPGEGTVFLLVGLGLLSNGSRPDQLQGIYLPMVSTAKCEEILKNWGINHLESQFCVGNLSVQDKDGCQGDSGGPVSFNSIQYGVVSWGQSCGLIGNPGIYSNLMMLNVWIRQKIKQMGYLLL